MIPLLAGKNLVSLHDIMRAFKPEEFGKLHHLLGFIEGLGYLKDFGEDTIIINKVRVSVSETVLPYQSRCIELGLKTSAITINRILVLLAEPNATYGKLRKLVDELHGRITDEMTGTLFLSLTAQEAKCYNEPIIGWQEIIQRFPGTIRDIEEAYKSFALGRYAAAVFHSVRVIEVGLIELGKFIQVVDPISGWAAVTKRLRQIISTKYENRSKFEKENFAFLEQMQGVSEALKNAWRNKVNHAGEKPFLMVADIIPEIAEEILMASRAFMRTLADGLPPLPPPDEYVHPEAIPGSGQDPPPEDESLPE